MAYQTGAASSQEDLMDKLQIFAAANGWTVDNFDTTNDKLSLHKGTVYVHFHWDNTDDIAMFQSLGFIAAGTDVDSHTDDSGNPAQPTGAITTGHRLSTESNGPYPSYHFFEDGGGSESYIYVVLEHATGIYRHMCFGEIQKFGTWTGGEFACAGFQAANQLNTPWRGDNHNQPFSASTNGQVYQSFLHVESLPNQAASGKWGCFGDHTTARGNDTAGIARARIVGGSTGGPYANEYWTLPLSGAQAFVPFIPVPVWYVDTSTSPNRWYLLGYAPNFRLVNLTHFVPGVEISYGGDIWVPFPMWKKTLVYINDSGIEQSGMAGFAFKKIT